MKKYQNEGTTDRIIRLVIGVVVGIFAYSFTQGTMQTVLYIIAFIGVLTGITGFCGLYKLLGISTKKK